MTSPTFIETLSRELGPLVKYERASSRPLGEARKYFREDISEDALIINSSIVCHRGKAVGCQSIRNPAVRRIIVKVLALHPEIDTVVGLTFFKENQFPASVRCVYLLTDNHLMCSCEPGELAASEPNSTKHTCYHELDRLVVSELDLTKGNCAAWRCRSLRVMTLIARPKDITKAIKLWMGEGDELGRRANHLRVEGITDPEGEVVSKECWRALEAFVPYEEEEEVLMKPAASRARGE
jgi:hypothetical protein